MPLRLPSAQDRNGPPPPHQRGRHHASGQHPPPQRPTSHQISHMNQDAAPQYDTHSRHPSRHPSRERIYDGQAQMRPSRGILQNSGRQTPAGCPCAQSLTQIDSRAVICPPKVYHRTCPKGSIAPQFEGPPGAVRAVCPPGTRPARGKFYDLYDQYGNPYVPMEPTRIHRKYIRMIMFILYILSIIIMIWDLVVNITEVIIFYMICNAILLFRVFGVFWLTRSLHFIMFFVVLILFALIDWENTNVFNAMCCLIPYVIVLLFSLHMVFFRPGRTFEERANRASCHALTGLLVVIVIFWVTCFLINFSDLQCILEMIYLFLFLIIVLTPHFQTKSHAAVKARKECERQFPECRRRFEPCAAPTCCVPTKPCCNPHQDKFVCPEPGGLQNADYCCDRRSRTNVRRTRSHDRLDRRRSSSRTSLCGRRKQRSRSEESNHRRHGATVGVAGAAGPVCACGSSLVPLDSISLPDETNSGHSSTTCVTRNCSPTGPMARPSGVPCPCPKASRTVRATSAPNGGRPYGGAPQYRGASAPGSQRGGPPFPPPQQQQQYYQQQQQPPPSAPLQGGGMPRRGSPSPGPPSGPPQSHPPLSRGGSTRSGHQSRYRGVPR